MSTLRIYITPWESPSEYGDEIEVTNDVKLESMNRLKQQVDNSEFDVGLFKFNDTAITMNNQLGYYSLPGTPTTIFQAKRTNSKIRVTWQQDDEEPECGIVFCGEFSLSEPVTIFKGILNDDASQSDIESQHITFKILGREAIFDLIETPFGSLSIGDTFSEVMFTCLDQKEITDLFTVDVLNIVLPIDLALDAVAQWENSTVKEVLDDLLLYSNSVIFIDDDTAFIQSREPTPTVQYTFYGQAATDGLENIQAIKNYKLSLNKTFNLWTWADSAFTARDTPSIDLYGVRKKEVGFDGITDTGKIAALLNELRTEFANPKQEFDLTTPMNYETLELFIGDRITVDYPTVLVAPEGEVLPIYDLSIYDSAVYPIGEWSITVDKNDAYKIMGRTIDSRKQLLTFKVREI